MDSRQPKILELRNNKWAWSAIGAYFGISRARAFQIGSGYKQGLPSREVALERDNYICQWQEKCKGKFERKNLIIHHKDFDDTNNSLRNLTTFCRACHRYYHSRFHPDKDKEKLLQAGHMYITKLIRKKCANCGIKFELTKSSVVHSLSLNKDFCCRECSREYKRKAKTFKCKGCGREYVIKNYVRQSRFCSRLCLGRFVGKNYGFGSLTHNSS